MKKVMKTNALRIRSNLNLEVVLEVKKAKNAKLLKISQSFLAIFG